jgi:hypothetical protein
VTTIAANRKTMAADTRVIGAGPMYHTNKIFHIGDALVGVAGAVGHTTKFLAWFRKECPQDEVAMNFSEDDPGFAALVLRPSGLFYYADCCEPDRLHEKHFAIGTGGGYAVVAMDNGKTPAQAVRCAMKYDEGTGGKVTELHLSEPKQKKGKPKPATPPAQEAPPDAQTAA